MHCKLSKVKLSTKKFIIISGITRSGKTILSPIISSLKNCEQFFFNTASENLVALNLLRRIEFDVAKNLIRRCINEEVQDKVNGRNLNNKMGDFTSIRYYKNKKIYTERLKSSLKKVEKSIEYKNNFFPILFHEALVNLQLVEKSFSNPKIINISRHPVDLMQSWL